MCVALRCCVCVCVRGALALVAFHLSLRFVPPLYHQTPREALRARGLASPQGLCPVGTAFARAGRQPGFSALSSQVWQLSGLPPGELVLSQQDLG